jgi:glycosyltransferase involved in cell wall biosynthesis
MSFLIITHVPHVFKNNEYYAYAPYTNEMNIWIKYFEKIIIVAPLKEFEITEIHQKYSHNNIKIISIPDFSLINFSNILKTIFVVPVVLFKMIHAFFLAEHIHLRCPGNIGLLGCFVQIFFSKKIKTAKYAGNWDPKAKQPFSYKFQRWILSNTFLTRNMKVLVYGEWANQPKNIKPFFTATYKESDKMEFVYKSLSDEIKFLFVGTLVIGKRPFYAIQIIEKLVSLGHNVTLELYGDGIERDKLANYIKLNNLENQIFLKGNHNAKTLKEAYNNSHFMILPSISEGWPKAVAEAMFFGCLPIATSVSCVPNMLDYGKRGLLLKEEINVDVLLIEELISNQDLYNDKIKAASTWSQNYTIDKFEKEIQKMLLD